MYLISACLLGVKCKYDGGDNHCPSLADPGGSKILIPVCPEQLGGLATPRMACEIRGGDGHAVWDNSAGVFRKDGHEVTGRFKKGAEQVLRLALLLGVEGAIFKSGSPSCGCGRIRDGSFKGFYREGDGVTTALLKKHGIAVFTEADHPLRAEG